MKTKKKETVKINLCEFDYCIYNKGKECILSGISISAAGFCDDCIIPDIDNEILEKYKQAARSRLE